jgi:hypothetical protein
LKGSKDDLSAYVQGCNQKVSGLVVWSENCNWYSSLQLGAVVSLFCESVLVSFAAKTHCVASKRVFIFVVYFVIDSVRKLLDTLPYGQMDKLTAF